MPVEIETGHSAAGLATLRAYVRPRGSEAVQNSEWPVVRLQLRKGSLVQSIGTSHSCVLLLVLNPVLKQIQGKGDLPSVRESGGSKIAEMEPVLRSSTLTTRSQNMPVAAKVMVDRNSLGQRS